MTLKTSPAVFIQRTDIMKYRMLLRRVASFKTVNAHAVMLGSLLMLSACSKSIPMYPQAQAYNQSVHGFDKGMRAMLMCTNLPPLQIRKNVELDIKSYVTKDPFEKVSGWYESSLSGWRAVAPTGNAKPMEQCPSGVSYVTPENCRPEECAKQLYILNEGTNETWIVTLAVK